MVEDYPPLSRHLLRLARMPSLPQLFPSAIMGIASVAVGAAEERSTHGGRIPSNVSFANSSSSDVHPRNNSSHVSTSATPPPPPPPPDVSSHDLRRRRRHRDDGCVASHRDDDFIVGNSNIPLKGGGGEGEDLTTNDSWDPSSPSYRPPSLRTDPSLFRQ